MFASAMGVVLADVLVGLTAQQDESQLTGVAMVFKIIPLWIKQMSDS